ncbi:MAG: prephenate dehydratase [Clostridiales bacterium]|nr:prephenate dehydratase [Clostridiales bacterium]
MNKDKKTEEQNIENIDKKIAELFAERLTESRKADEGMLPSEIALKCRKYERDFLVNLAEDKGEFEGYERVLFSTLFNLSHAYKLTGYGAKTDLADKITSALESTPKQFPETAFVACQGVEGANSQIAADKLFRSANIMYVRTFEGVFQAVENGLCKYGILPIENSSFGSVTSVYDLMKNHSFYIVRCIKLQINHRLLAKPGCDLSGIREVFSHEQAIGQCSNFLKEHSDIKITVVENTAVAAKMVADSDRTDVAAISSPDCASLYGLSVISDSVQNTDHNYTRFICISKDMQIFPGSSKISMMLSLGHTPGSLSDTLVRFSSLGLNLTKLESRPISGRDFEFMFYLDVEASVYSDKVLAMLCELDASSNEFTFLGSYSEV